MQRKVIRDTKIFNADELYRDLAPAGMLIEGRQDGDRWVCTFTTTYPVTIKIGWYVKFMDTIAVTGQLPPEPQPANPTTPANALPIQMPDGTKYTNRDPIVWVKS